MCIRDSCIYCPFITCEVPVVLYLIYRLVFLQHHEEYLRLKSRSTLMPMVLSTFQLETRELAKNNRVGHLLILYSVVMGNNNTKFALMVKFKMASY